MGLVVRMRVGDGRSPPAPTPGVDAGGRSGDPAIIIGSGTVALPLRLALSHERHASPYRQGVDGGGGTQSSAHRGPSKAFGDALRKHVE